MPSRSPNSRSEAGDASQFDRDRPDPGDAGQAGDTQGLSGVEGAASESVRELVQEDQIFEAEFVSGFENAPDADVAEVRTHQVPVDDVPLEYLEGDDDEPKED
jgi:hypothetical protein